MPSRFKLQRARTAAILGIALVAGLAVSRVAQQPAVAASGSGTSVPVYTDALVGGYQAWTWNSSIGLKNTSPVYSGSNSIKLTIKSAYGGVEFHNTAGVSAATDPYVHFAARAGANGGHFSIAATDVNDNEYASPVPLATLGGDPVSTGWSVYNVPLASLGAGTSSVYSLVFQDQQGSAEPAVYLDEISFGAAGSSPSVSPSPTASPTKTPAPSPSPTATPSPSSSGRRVVAYYPLWAQDSYPASSIDYTIVTHVIQSAIYANADGSLNLTADGSFPNPIFVPAVHAGGAKAMLGLAENEGSTNFSRMAASATAQQAFVTNVMNLVNQYGYDGLDIDWEFPASSADRTNLTSLVATLRAALGPGRVLSIAAPTGNWAGQYYDIPSLMPYLDWVGAMTYDYAGIGWTTTADNNAPLYTASSAGSVNDTMSYYLGRGVPKSKLLIGLPFYGRQYDGASALYQTLTNQQGGALSYASIAPMINNGWTMHRASTADVPYLLRTDGSPGVISYDDATSIQTKCSFVVSQGLAGVIIWHVGQDSSGAPATQTLLQATRGCR